jgi:hypothetical protein
LLKQGLACWVVATVDSSWGERLGVADSGWVTSTPPYFGACDGWEVGEARGACALAGAIVPSNVTTDTKESSRTSGRETVMATSAKADRFDAGP